MRSTDVTFDALILAYALLLEDPLIKLCEFGILRPSRDDKTPCILDETRLKHDNENEKKTKDFCLPWENPFVINHIHGLLL